jgi:hypothetical protein
MTAKQPSMTSDRFSMVVTNTFAPAFTGAYESSILESVLPMSAGIELYFNGQTASSTMNLTYNNIAYSNGAFEGKIISKFGEDIEYMYKTYSNNFPKSKKLIINFDKIILTNKNSNEKIAIEGSWNLEVDLPKTMYSRETMVYNVKDCTSDDIIVTKAQVSNTAMKFELVTRWGEPVYTEKDSEGEKNRKIEEFFNNTHSVRNIIIKDEYVENDKGEKFYPVKSSSDGNEGYNQMFSGMLRHWQTFDLTKYNSTDTLKVVFELNGKQIEIELERKKI